jgi:hypothetical protein
MTIEASYLAALGTLCRAFAAYQKHVGHPAVLVGGAAVTIYTAGAFQSGDFDIVATDDEAFEYCLLAEGFLKESRAGYLQIGYHHNGHPQFGFQIVSGRLFDGLSDRDRLVRCLEGPFAGLVIPSVEDLIADRLGQHEAYAKSDTSRLRQARLLLELTEAIDSTYLWRRTKDEGGNFKNLGLPEDALTDANTVPQAARTIYLLEFLQEVEKKKLALGVREDTSSIDELRNDGAMRTPEKRILLARSEVRARNLGVTPVKQHI